MSGLKLGKLGSVGGRKPKPELVQEAKPTARMVWDDFAPAPLEKRANKKKEFERSSGNRMLPKKEPRKDFDRKRPLEGEEFLLGEREVTGRPESDYAALESVIGYSFKERDLLKRALTHRSALGFKDRADYERLEFLGDAVLDLGIAHLLCDKYPDAREGELSKMRAAIVNTQALSEIAKKLELNTYIRLGRGEHASGGAERPSILADVMEAIIGAMYLDSSYGETFKIVEAVFGSSLEQVTPYDPKTELQELLHVRGSEPPSYLLELVEGPEHAPTFITVVSIDGEIVGRGRGATKKASQQLAAAEALARMRPTVPAITLRENQTIFIPELLLAAAA